MEIIQSGRRMGKTTYLLSRLEQDPESVMVVHSYQERDRLKREIHERWDDIDIAGEIANRIVSIDSIISGHLRGRQFSEIHVDNLDLILPYLLGGKIGTVTTTDG